MGINTQHYLGPLFAHIRQQNLWKVEPVVKTQAAKQWERRYGADVVIDIRKNISKT